MIFSFFVFQQAACRPAAVCTGVAAIDSQFAVFPAGEKFLPANQAHCLARRFPMLRHRVVIPPQSAACVGAKFPVPACPVLHNGSAALRAELMHHAIQKFLFVLFHRVSPRMLHLAAKPLCFLRKAGKNALKMTRFSRITFIGRIGGEKKPPFVVFFFHCKQNHMEYLQFQKECLILFPVSSGVSQNAGASGMLPICCFRFAPESSDPRAVKFAVLHV
ncbi:hypothetical protein [Butyricicoccus sp.]|uniref:hypothetical protein n=1 Tax=Butyricicoccus sp. TaxID=2049021 RepID=UPI003F17CEB6